MPRTGSDVGPSRAPAPRRAFIHRRLVAAAVTVASAIFAFIGCASVLDIDGDYVFENSQSDGGSGFGTATGGKTGAGGASSGGALASGGSESGGAAGNPSDGADAACTEGGTDCPAGTKCCGGSCVETKPIVGCGATACKPCDMPPASGTMMCAADPGGTELKCAIKCNPNFELVANSVCEPVQSNTGGTTGSGGAPATGGAAPAGCDAKLCPGCGAPGPFGCCKNDNQCGCSWTPSGSGYCL